LVETRDFLFTMYVRTGPGDHPIASTIGTVALYKG
jgi:hypothetical protein